MVLRPRLRLLVVEDDESLRELLDLALQDSGFDVQVLSDGDELEAALANFAPDLAVLDVNLGVGKADGFALARHLRRMRLPVIFLTAADGLDDRLTGFQVGADDYITKPFSTSELLARIRAVLRRSGKLGPTDALRVGDVRIDEDGRTVRRGHQQIDLTRREFDLLVAFAHNAERVLSKTQLLSLVWGFDEYDPNVVEVCVSSLRRKLEDAGPRLVHTVRGVGYVLRV